ncbi:ABC transporter substrate-binding protein [Methylopila musalis]|uniref:ABC transporter substrate-binding protein n=1 Tax=Methylopila musalis TaxID=1134781 RepID=A0ABW3Z6U0_9HYPH
MIDGPRRRAGAVGESPTLTRRAFAALTLAGAAFPLNASWADEPRRLRIAALDWAGAEALLALGVIPIAIADSAGYRRQFAHAALPDSVLDLGGRWQPNFELLASLKPDLLIVSTEKSPDEEVQRRIAPRLAMSLHGAGLSPLAAAAAALRRVASVVGRAAAAEAVVAAGDAVFDRAAQSHAVATGPGLIVAVLEPDGLHITVHAKGGLIGETMERCGVRDGWTRPTASIWGFSRIGIERLADAPEARIVVIDQGQRTARALRSLAGSTLWRSLPQVKAGRVTRMPDLFPFGGFPTAVRLARELHDIVAHGAARAG